MIHRVQCRCRYREEPQVDMQLGGSRHALLCGVGCAPIFEQHEAPAAPIRADHRKKVLMGRLIPYSGDEQPQGSRMNIECAVHHTLSAIAGDGHAPLLPLWPIATRRRRRFCNARLIQHQYDVALSPSQAALEPPLAWRHVAERRAKSSRGRFHTIPNRAKARLTLRWETSIRWVAGRACRRRAAVHTVER